MASITSIQLQKSQKRVNIYLDGKFGFGLDLENFVKSKIKVGQELSEEETNKLIGEDSFKKVTDYLLRYATMRPRSAKEIGVWFKKKKIGIVHQNKLLKKLEKLELIDDEKFAKWWVEQRLQFKSKSRRELEQELKLKGIDKDIIVKVLEDCEMDEEKSAFSLLQKNFYKWQRYNKHEAKNKMSQFLMRKGFSWKAVLGAVKKTQD